MQNNNSKIRNHEIQKCLPHSTTQHTQHFFTPSSQSLQRLSPLYKMVASHNLHGLTKLIVVQLLLGISMQMKWFIKHEYLYFDNMQKYFGQTFFTVMKTEDHSSKVTFGSLFMLMIWRDVYHQNVSCYYMQMTLL